MEFRILGPLEAVDAGEPVALPTGKPAALLAILLLRANEVVPVDVIVDQLWGARPPPTAGHLVHVYVSQLRKALGDRGGMLATRSPGYVLTLGPGDLDLYRFELRLREARDALDADEPSEAVRLGTEALDLWRGPPLADFSYESFALAAIGRLEELHLMARELRIEAELRLERSAELVPELESLVAEHPLRERLRGQLMTALYRSGRQAQALETYQDLRRRLAEELGLDPGPALRDLERAILRQDPELRPTPGRPPELAESGTRRSVLVYARDPARLDALVAIGERLAARQGRELILVSVARDADALPGVTEMLHARRAALGKRGVQVRAAAFTSPDPGGDVVRLASRYAADLVLTDASESPPSGAFADDVEALLGAAPSDVALLVTGALGGSGDGPVYVLFGGAEHDWAAAELAAWAARSIGAPLRLLGTAADPEKSRRDASGLLAHASLVVQHVAGIAAEPVLVRRDVNEVVAATQGGSFLAIGLSPARSRDDEASFRAQVAERAHPATVLVRAGLRPGGTAPAESLTRFTWTIARASS
jgi:DNA-binding SARP family transcriptional activator